MNFIITYLTFNFGRDKIDSFQCLMFSSFEFYQIQALNT